MKEIYSSRDPQELLLYFHRGVGALHAALLLSQQELPPRAEPDHIGEKIGESETKPVHHQHNFDYAGRILFRAAQ